MYYTALLALVVSFHWPIQKLNVENAFLNGDLQEEVYMVQPPGFMNPQHPQYVFRLNKVLYGLKQAPRAWFHKLRLALLDVGFQSSRTYTFLFIYHTAVDIVIVLVNVDDILVTGCSSTLVFQIIAYLHKTFSIHDLGELSYFLGIHVQYCGNTMHLSQTKYIHELLQLTNL